VWRCYITTAAVLIAFVALSIATASVTGAKSPKVPPFPTATQVAQCEKALTGHSRLNAKQVANCLVVVRQTYDPQPCPKDPTNPLDSQYVKPSGYLIDLAGGYMGVHGSAAHTWAIRAGSRPFPVKSSATQGTIDAAICTPPG
jgi:hypothetical protein